MDQVVYGSVNVIVYGILNCHVTYSLNIFVIRKLLWNKYKTTFIYYSSQVYCMLYTIVIVHCYVNEVLHVLV